MWRLVSWYDGGYCEEVIFSCETLEEMMAYINSHEDAMNGDGYGEEGTDLRDPQGHEVEVLFSYRDHQWHVVEG